MKKIIYMILLCCVTGGINAQVKWREPKESGVLANVGWNNYSTSYMGKDADSTPFLMTALPYNGIYEIGSADGAGSSALNMTFDGSAFRYRSNLSDNHRELETYDSSDVYFLSPGILRSNAEQYEYRVLEDSVREIQSWTGVTRFTDDSFEINAFKKGMAFLGGYKTGWGHCLAVELRKKGQAKILSVAIVYWRQTRPTLLGIMTPSELTERILSKKQSFDLGYRWIGAAAIPARRELPAGENSLIFFCNADVYKKTAMEYALLKNGEEIRAWGPNEHDNNCIWLKGLGPGHYTFRLRFRKQRHNVMEYPFSIAPAWYQGWGFRVTAGVLILGLLAAFLLLGQLRKQRRRTAAEQLKKEQHALELRSIHAQLNPHFIFNALSSIQGLINKNDVAGANRYLSDFGSLVRHYLTDSHKELVPLEREIRTLDTYLQLEQLRFKFSYSIVREDDVPVTEIEIPSLLLQPLVENAVRHGAGGLQEQGHIGVHVSRRGKDLWIGIVDNGPGFEMNGEHAGYGLKLTRDRIRVLNEMAEQPHIEWTVGRNEAGGRPGVSIRIVFKNWLS